MMTRNDFGKDFIWGVATAAHQIEGAVDVDGKGPSIWDVFGNKRGKIKNGEHALIACDFYHRYEHDLTLLEQLNIPNFRFSTAWSRILPEGTGHVNQAGLDFYKRLTDALLEKNITPWVTIYHWDLPHVLELKGGWTNRDVLGWFEEYAEVVVHALGDRVKHWMVLNEPMVFTGAGYFLGYHAPGRRGFSNFIPAMHHATLAMGVGGHVVRQLCPEAQIGTTFSCSHIEPMSSDEKDIAAATRVDALLNRLYIEPLLGMGYPLDELPRLASVEKYFKTFDEVRIPFDFDFIGVQNYTREVVRYSWVTPYLQASLVSPKERNVPYTLMNWEVYPEALYQVLKKFAAYRHIPRLMVTENGAAFNDVVQNGKVHDHERLHYLQQNIAQMLRAKKEGVQVDGYFVWTFTDNFEWAEGYTPRFGLVHIDFKTQKRTIKDSGLWYSEFMANAIAQPTLATSRNI
jgi:beta-glucosidase